MTDHVANTPSERELTTALTRSWWPVARIDDLASPISATILDRRILVYRTADGLVCVADDTCPHRGAQLSRGTVVGDAIQCPYHGWQWDGATGACLRIPSLADDGVIPPAARLKTYPAKEYFGVVWTCLSAKPFADFPPPGATDEHQWDIRTATTVFETNLVAAMENFRDIAHIYFVHSDTIQTRSPFVDRLKPKRDGLKLTMSRGFDAVGDAFYFKEPPMDHFYTFIPNMGAVMSEVEGTENRAWLSQFVCPMSLDTTKVFIAIGTGPSFEGTADEMMAKEQVIFSQDKSIMDTIRPCRLGEQLNRPVSTLSDAYTLLLRRTFFEYITAANDDRETAPRTRGEVADPA